MSTPPESLDPHLAELLDAERSPPAPEAALARVWARTEAVIGAGAGGAGGAAGAKATAGGKVLAFAGTKAGAVLVTLLATSAVMGGAYRATRPAHPSAPNTARIEARTPPHAPVLGDAAWRPLPASEAAPSSPSPSAFPTVNVDDLPSAHGDRPPAAGPSLRAAEPVRPAAEPAPPAASALAEERALLDEASRALARDDGPRALQLTELHAQRFPSGQLAEERESVAVEALVLSRRYEEARARGARFRSTWGGSLFLPAVAASLASIPEDKNR